MSTSIPSPNSLSTNAQKELLSGILIFIFVIFSIISIFKIITDGSFLQFLQTEKHQKILYILSFFIIFVLIIVLIFIIFKDNSANTSGIETNLFITLFVILIVLLLIKIFFLESDTELGMFLRSAQIKNTFFVILYTIFLILFFGLTSPSIINNYARLILLTTMIGGAFLFYIALKTNFTNDFEIRYERIKTIIIFFCLIAVLLIYYIVNPGGYITKLLGPSFVFTIVIIVFAFLYLITIITLSDEQVVDNKTKVSSALSGFSSISTYGVFLFFSFIIAMVTIIIVNPNNFFNNMSNFCVVMVISLIIIIIWCSLIGFTLFPESYDNSITDINKLNLTGRALLILFGMIMVAMLVTLIVYYTSHYAGESNIISIILNGLILLAMVGLIYKTIMVKLPAGNNKKNAFFSLITNFIFYLPCLFTDGFEMLLKNVFYPLGNAVKDQYNSTSYTYVLILIFSILGLIVYYVVPSIVNILVVQGGKQLVNAPVYTNTVYSLGNSEQLNGITSLPYQYAISFWVYLDGAGPNMNESYDTYTSLLNFGGKPNVLYNGKHNTLIVTMEIKHLKQVTTNQFTDFDDNGSKIVYKNSKMFLQKWNNIILNYNKGFLDVFLNGELVKTDIGVPHYKVENLTIGKQGGIEGGICNVIYFRRALNYSHIYYLYHLCKNRTPPLLNESNETITNEDLQLVKSSIKSVTST